MWSSAPHLRPLSAWSRAGRYPRAFTAMHRRRRQQWITLDPVQELLSKWKDETRLEVHLCQPAWLIKRYFPNTSAVHRRGAHPLRGGRLESIPSSKRGAPAPCGLEKALYCLLLLPSLPARAPQASGLFPTPSFSTLFRFARGKIKRNTERFARERGMKQIPAVSRLAMCACLAVTVFPGRLVHLPRLASGVTLAVRADARDVIYLSIYQSRSFSTLFSFSPLRLPSPAARSTAAPGAPPAPPAPRRHCRPPPPLRAGLRGGLPGGGPCAATARRARRRAGPRASPGIPGPVRRARGRGRLSHC